VSRSDTGSAKDVVEGCFQKHFHHFDEVSTELQRGVATVPLLGIDVPFHSSHLRPGVQSYRMYLQQKIHETGVRASSLIGKWIPNVMAKPFALDGAYIAEAARLTGSPILSGI
jgi:fatty acid synthase subunit beta